MSPDEKGREELSDIEREYWKGFTSELLKSEKFEEGIEAAKRHLKNSPNDIQALNYIGDAAMHLERYDLALEYARKALQALQISGETDTTKRGKLLHNLAMALHRSGSTDEAAEEMLRALELLPNLELGWYKLAAIYTRLGKLQQAKSALERALRLGKGGRSRRALTDQELAPLRRWEGARELFEEMRRE